MNICLVGLLSSAPSGAEPSRPPVGGEAILVAGFSVVENSDTDEVSGATDGRKVVATGWCMGRVIVRLSSFILTPSISAWMIWIPCSASCLLSASRLEAMLETLSLLLLLLVASLMISVRLSITTCSGDLFVVAAGVGNVVVDTTVGGVVDDVIVMVVFWFSVVHLKEIVSSGGVKKSLRWVMGGGIVILGRNGLLLL